MNRVAKLPADVRAWLDARVVVDGNCWVWQLALKDGVQPQAKRNGKILNVRRMIFDLCTGKAVRKSWAVSCSCETRGCVHPDHLKVIARTEFLSGRTFSLTHKANLAAAARANAKLTSDAVRAIRESEAATKEVAAAHGISTDHVLQVRKFICWKDYSSPFAGLGALA